MNTNYTAGRLGNVTADSKATKHGHYDPISMKQQQTDGPKQLTECIESFLLIKEQEGLYPPEQVQLLLRRLGNA